MSKKITPKFTKKDLKVFKQSKNVETKSSIKGFLSEDFTKRIIFIAIVVIAVIFLFLKFSIVKAFFAKLISILMPIIIGFILMYLMVPLYNLVEEKFPIKKLSKQVATLACLLCVLLIGAGLIFLFVPQLYASVANFAKKVPQYIEKINDIISNYRKNANDAITNQMFDGVQNVIDEMFKTTTNTLNGAEMTTIFTGLFNGFYASFKTVLNIFVGLVVMIYTLNMKQELAFGAKRVLFAFCNKTVAKSILAEVRFAHKVFSGFIVGKLLDSLIIGVLCYICCLIMKMPYTPLVSVIVGVTNIIPFFGPFIGAIPSFVIILLEEPFTWRPWGFLVFILILQQLDGNVIGPKILGDKTGVGSFWVLFSILLFGGLFGFVGMIVAVPLWAIITKIFNEQTVLKLQEKGLPLTTEDYNDLKAYYEALKEK